MYLLKWSQDLFHLFFPNLCLACAEWRAVPDEMLCIRCLTELPQTHFHTQKNNPFTDVFWGRVPLEAAAALYYLRKSGYVQQLVYQLKYQNKKMIGNYLGKSYGYELINNPVFQSVDYLIPVPLHKRKLRLRGYNQSACFAQGLGESMRKPVLEKVLKRIRFTASQTRKGRWHRLENVADAFEVKSPHDLFNKHVLLVDDVLTTGATLEACATKLLEIEGLRLSMVTIGFAR